MPLAPTPFHLLRSHHAPISAVHFNHDNTLLYAGDQDGFVSVSDLNFRRVILFWKAHEGGVLGLEEWEGRMISQGRDNLIHFYDPFPRLGPSILASTASSTTFKSPSIARSIPTNSLNFCRFSLCLLNNAQIDDADSGQEANCSDGKSREREALLAVPSLMDSELADIYHLPSFDRLHSSLNASVSPSSTEPLDGPHIPSDASENRTGLIMSLHLAFRKASENQLCLLHLAMGFEDGRVELWKCVPRSEKAGPSKTAECWRNPSNGRKADGEKGWAKMWSGKRHNEAVMAMAVSRDMSRAFTVSADHLLCRYNFSKIVDDCSSAANSIESISSYSVKQIGNASVALSADEMVVAVGGWDGCIRLFSTSTFKPLGILEYHRDTVHVISFANLPRSFPVAKGITNPPSVAVTEEIGQDSDVEDDRVDDRRRWMVSGGKDTRVALWELMDFGAGRT